MLLFIHQFMKNNPWASVLGLVCILITIGGALIAILRRLRPVRAEIISLIASLYREWNAAGTTQRLFLCCVLFFIIFVTLLLGSYIGFHQSIVSQIAQMPKTTTVFGIASLNDPTTADFETFTEYYAQVFPDDQQRKTFQDRSMQKPVSWTAVIEFVDIAGISLENKNNLVIICSGASMEAHTFLRQQTLLKGDVVRVNGRIEKIEGQRINLAADTIQRLPQK